MAGRLEQIKKAVINLVKARTGYSVYNIKKAVDFMNIVAFGAHIARLRKERDIPQSRLADMLAVTRQAVSKWERGEGFPDIALLCRLAELFDTTVDSLIRAGEASKNESAILVSVSRNQRIASEILEDVSAIQDIINVAPYLKASDLTCIAGQFSKHNINISRIVELAEFMTDESVAEMIKNSDMERLDDELLSRMIPFMDTESAYAVFDKILSGENSAELIKRLRPFINGSLIEAAYMHGVLDPSEV